MPGAPQAAGGGLELFRRAVCGRDEDACERLVRQYERLVLSWIRQHPAALPDPGDDLYLVTCTFERFWHAVGPDRFERFGDLPALLAYLKLCAASVVLDEARRRRRPVEVLSLDQLSDHTGEATQVPDRAPDPESQLVARTEREDLWATVRRLLPDEAQRRLVYLRFALGLTPQEIVRQCPERYPTATEVYRATRKALNRLRRSPQLRRFRNGGIG